MTSKNLARRLEQLEERLLPDYEEPIVFAIIAVDADGQGVDSGIRIKVGGAPKPIMKRRW